MPLGKQGRAAERVKEHRKQDFSVYRIRKVPGVEEGHVCFSVSKDCLADVTADGGGQERRTGARSKVVSRAVSGEELPLARATTLIFASSLSSATHFWTVCCQLG